MHCTFNVVKNSIPNRFYLKSCSTHESDQPNYSSQTHNALLFPRLQGILNSPLKNFKYQHFSTCVQFYHLQQFYSYTLFSACGYTQLLPQNRSAFVGYGNVIASKINFVAFRLPSWLSNCWHCWYSHFVTHVHLLFSDGTGNHKGYNCP